MLQLASKFGESKWNLYWLIVLIVHLSPIMSPTIMKILTNMTHLQYHEIMQC